jgi:dolichyl-phosphate-mannose-protein mannosyltransferase
MPDDRLWGWIGPLAVTVLAGILRFWHLGQPHQFIFDETYYAKDAYSLLQHGYEENFVQNADKLILHGNLDVFLNSGSFVVHPPLGKWLIAIGEQIFGVNPFGWRVVVALLGTFSVLLVARITRRMARSTLIGTIAGFLLAIDGMHLVMSRSALLDLPLSFFLLAAFGALVIDRDVGRRRSFERLDDFARTSVGPRLGFRPWRLAAGILLGCALATKWNALYFIMAFGFLTVLWDVAARRVAGARAPWLGAIRRDALPAFVSIVPPAFVVYVASWTGWFATSGAYDRNWGSENPPSALDSWVPNWWGMRDAVRGLWHYHVEAFNFHTNLTSPHPYASHPLGWLIQARPVSFYYHEYKMGQHGCTVSVCAREVVALGNPVIWWGAVVALIAMIWLLVSRRDWRAGAVLAAVAAGWLPWIWYADHDDRTMFSFYAVAFLPFLAMAVAFTLGAILGPRDASPTRRALGATFVGGFLILAILASVALFPLWVGDVIPKEEWWNRLLRIHSWV